MKRYTVCLSFYRNFCEKSTKEVAEKNKAIGYEIVAVPTKIKHQVAYRGEIIIKEN